MEFQSPLLVTKHHEFTSIDFGQVTAAPEVIRLRQELNGCLTGLTRGLPEPLGEEARTILSSYSGGDFFRLFYQPVWSFLHWVHVGDQQLLAEAREAHALSLFLHLWDDHLTDGQLAPDLLRLQLRTKAWERYTALGRSLCLRAGADPGLVDHHVSEYLTALHRPTAVTDAGSYAERFRRQVAIWTLVPRLLGEAAGGPEAARALVQVVQEFAVAWRWIDDLQDVDQDLLEGKETAVWLELDGEGRRRWAAAAASAGAWGALAESIRVSGCLERLLSFAAGRVRSAIRAAESQGWWGMAGELRQALWGVDPAGGGPRV